MGWIIFAVIILLITLLLFLRIRLILLFDKNLLVKIKVLFISYQLYPPKQEKVKEKDFSLKKLRKKSKKTPSPKKRKVKSKTEKQKSKLSDLPDLIKTIKILVEDIIMRFGRYLKVDVTQIYVKVASSDAAQTAIIYGIVSQGVSYIVELLSNFTRLRATKDSQITVVPNYIEDTSEIKINITFSLLLWQILFFGLRSFMAFTKFKSYNPAKGQDNNDGKQQN